MMAWEAHRLSDPHRAVLARMVLEHRVLPRDPLKAVSGDQAALLKLLEAV
jgi:acyl-CoA dehydrogenase